MYTLYWEYMAGSIVVQAMLEAADAEYRLRYVDMGQKAHLTPAFLEINPAGRVPVLGLADGQCIGETAAIVTVLGEAFPESALTPLPGEADRARFLYWLSVMSTAGYATSSRVGHPERFARDDSAICQVKAQADKDFDDFFDLMEEAIEGQGSFLGRGVTALDYYVVMLTEWVDDRAALLRTRPALRDLSEAVRPSKAYAHALETHAIPAVPKAAHIAQG